MAWKNKIQIFEGEVRMNHVLKTLLLILWGLSTQLSYATPLKPIEQEVIHDIGAMLLGGSQNPQLDVTDQGIYIEAQFCKKDMALFPLLENKLNIQHEQKLITLFQQMLCAPRNDQAEVDLKPFVHHLHDPIAVELVTYSGMLNLGQWSLDDSIQLSAMSAQDAQVSMLGLNPDSSLASVTFWQVLSPEHVRVWYGRFKMAPSDGIIYEFKFEQQKWMLSKLWLTSRI